MSAEARSRIGARDLLGQAWVGARTRPGRAVLSVIGVAIGVAAIVGVTGISASSRADLVARLDRLGTNLLVVGPGQSISGREAELSPLAPRMIRRVPPVLDVAATSAIHVASVRRSMYISAYAGGGIGLIATEPDLPATLGVGLRSGTFINAANAALPVAVLGAAAATHLGIERADGRQIWIDERRYAVIGILDPIALVPDLDRSVFVGWPNAVAALEFDGHPTAIYLRSAVDQVLAVRAVLARTADPAHPEDVQVSRPSDALAARAAANDTLTQLLIALGLVALLVAGIGIANVMLIGVLERRVEIGLRRALGATPRQVAAQFLVEAVTLGGVGGVLGCLVGFGMTVAFSAVSGWRLDLPAVAVGGGIAAAVLTSAVAGLYPALRASALAPMVALRGT